MTQPKGVSSTIRKLLDYPVVQDILNRNSDISSSVEIVKDYWGYDLLKRKPSAPYLEYGIFKSTDLDLACFLYALSGRGAVINIPQYKALRQSKLKEGEIITSKSNRNGQLTGVAANKDFFIFSIAVKDQNVISGDRVGEPRNFALTDFDGQFYSGWSELQFVPTLNENKFITENSLWTGNKIYFKNFIHPNRWTSFFGYHYIITKLLINRLSEECSHYYQQTKRLLDAGVKFPPKGGGPKPSPPIASVGEKKSMKFSSFQADIYIPDMEFVGDYPTLQKTSQNLQDSYDHRKLLLYKVIPRLRFMIRATEYAHYKAQDRFPGWIKNTKWESDFTIPGKRVKWERCKLFQTKPGEFSVSLLRRTYDKSTMVDIDY